MTESARPGHSLSLARNAPRPLDRPQPRLSAEQTLDWSVGRSFVRQVWVSAPSSTTARDGLGPLFNANSCAACHPGNGQGQLPEHGPGLILKLRGPSTTGDDNRHGGWQLQDRALPGFDSEGRIAWQETLHTRDGQVLPFRRYRVETGSDGVPPSAPVSPRLAPALIGQGLLDQVRDEQLLALSDPEDRDGDGISGRVNQVWDPGAGQYRVGRFGWKASHASLHHQIALAFSQDIGIRSRSFPSPLCPESAASCEPDPALEISDKLLDAVIFYIGHLALPAPVNKPADLPGRRVFDSLACGACHQPQMITRQKNGSDILFRPYSDLLLHDMGPALADDIGEFDAAGSEWRTAPLWGLGMRRRFLHDGRAGSVREAILWHGGEAETARQGFLALTPEDQDTLIDFLKAL